MATIRAGMGIASPASSPGNPLPSHRSKTWPTQAPTALRQAHAGGQHAGDLAVDGDRPLGAAGAIRQHAAHDARPGQRRSVGGEPPDQKREVLGHLAHHDGRHAGVEGDLVAADEGGLLVGVGCAADEAQQGEVVDVAEVAARPAQLPPRGDREQAGAQRLLQRLAHAQIGGQREGGDEFGEADAGGATGGHLAPDRDGRADAARLLARPARLSLRYTRSWSCQVGPPRAPFTA